MIKKCSIFFLIIILVLLLVSCKADDDIDSNVEDVVTIDFDTPEPGNATVPVDNPQDILPMYKNSTTVVKVDNDDGGFGLSAFSVDSVSTVTQFYENLLVNAQVIAVDISSVSYLNIGVLGGWAYTINVMDTTGYVDNDIEYYSNITIAYAPANLQQTSDIDSNIIVSDLFIIPSFYPSDTMPIYNKGLSEVDMVLASDGTNLLGYSSTESFSAILDYYKEIFKDATRFSTGTKELATFFSGEINGNLFDVRITENYEGSYKNTKYKTLVEVFYVIGD